MPAIVFNASQQTWVIWSAVKSQYTPIKVQNILLNLTLPIVEKSPTFSHCVKTNYAPGDKKYEQRSNKINKYRTVPINNSK